MADLPTELRTILSQSFGLAWPGLITKEQVIVALALRIEQLIAGNPDQLFSMLYRLDISEQKIKKAMHSDDTIAHKIAVLIFDRQLEKINSRKRFRSEKPGDDLAW